MKSERSRSAESKKLRFYLEVTSDVEAAPSIGAKRAAQLTDLGVATVTQLLEADPEDLAARLDDKRVDAATIVAWQHQAGLMCRVPGLRGHDAQLLVGSGFTTPERSPRSSQPSCSSSSTRSATRPKGSVSSAATRDPTWPRSASGSRAPGSGVRWTVA